MAFLCPFGRPLLAFEENLIKEARGLIANIAKDVLKAVQVSF
jgi:hypothetical protein